MFYLNKHHLSTLLKRNASSNVCGVCRTGRYYSQISVLQPAQEEDVVEESEEPRQRIVGLKDTSSIVPPGANHTTLGEELNSISEESDAENNEENISKDIKKLGFQITVDNLEWQVELAK